MMEKEGNRAKQGGKKKHLLPDSFFQLSTWQYLGTMLLFALMCWCGVKFLNAGYYYEQEVPFRIFCIAFAAIILGNMHPKTYCHLWTIIWLPLCYVITHFGYARHLIPDNCNYEHVDVIRLGKAVILLWGIMLISLLRELIKSELTGEFIRSIKESVLSKRILLLLWCLYAVFLTVMNPGYYYVIVFTVGFSVFFIVSRKENIRLRLWKAFLDGSLLAFLYVSVKALLRRPYDTERYLFYFSNENMAGMYLATVAVMLVFRLYDDWHSKGQQKGKAWRNLRLVADHLLLGWALVLVVFNYTRTYILGLVFSVLVFFVICMIRSGKKGRVLVHFLLPILCLGIMFYPGYLLIRYVPSLYDQPVFFTGEEGNPTRVQKGDPADSPHYTSLSRYMTLALGKMGITVRLDEEYAGVDEEDAAISIDEDRDVTNGRTYIWKQYLSRLSFAGHYPGHIVTDEDKMIYHAHNTFLQNTYQYGIPAGLLYFALIVYSYIYGAYILLKKKSTPNSRRMLIYGLLMLGVIMIGMLTEWSGHPCYPFGTALMIALMCIGYGGVEKAEKEREEES